jgi:hypothetical protein
MHQRTARLQLNRLLRKRVRPNSVRHRRRFHCRDRGELQFFVEPFIFGRSVEGLIEREEIAR